VVVEGLSKAVSRELQRKDVQMRRRRRRRRRGNYAFF